MRQNRSLAGIAVVPAAAALTALTAFGAFLAFAPPAGAEFTENTIGCQGSARVTADDGKVYNVNANDKTAKLPRNGSASWQGSVTTITHDHFGEVVIKIGPVKQKLGDWGPKPNTSDQPSKAGVKKIPSFMDQVPAGKYEVSGFHKGNEGRCAGRITVEVEGSPFDTPAGIATAVLTLLSLGTYVLAATRGKPVLGAIDGLLLGVFGTLELVFSKVVSSGTPLFLIAPVALAVAGAGLGIMRGRAGAGGVPAPPPPPV